MSKAGVSSALLSFCGRVSQLSRVELLCAFFSQMVVVKSYFGPIWPFI